MNPTFWLVSLALAVAVAIVLAMAGLLRLGKAEGLPGLLPQDPAEILPAVGQGALAIECRADRADVRELLSAIHDPDTAARVAAERAFLEGVEGSCQVPVAAHAVFVGEELHIDALVASLDGTETVRDRRAGPRSRAAELGQDLARSLLLAGGRAILDRCLAEAAT